jgi:hypothetical protein
MMQPKVVVFVPRAKQTARTNLADFVGFARHKLTVFGEDLPFEENIWDVSKWVESKGNKFAIRLRFSNLETAAKKTGLVPMLEPYLSFAKAYVRYQHGLSPKSNYSTCLTALRALEVALQELTGGRDPTDIRPDVLNRAAQLLKARYKPSTAYQCGSELQAIARLASDLRLVTVPSAWKSPVPAEERRHNRVGQEFDELRMQKIPSPAAFYALGHIFQNGTDAEDVLVSSACALLCGAPSRIAEVVLLPSACEVTQVDKETGKPLYGLGWRPAKNGEPMVKYVATPMHDVVREALQRLRNLSAPGIELARWYEKNPTRLYLPPDLEHLRGKDALRMSEVRSIVFVDDGTYHEGRPWQWVRAMKLPVTKHGHRNCVRFADVEAAVLQMLPRGFPVLDAERGLKYSDALMVVRRQELDVVKVTYRCMFQPIEPHDIASRIATRRTLNIFVKHGFKEDDGTEIELSTHKFRHYLNTLAQSNNMDQLDLARWSGRRNVSQNAAYDHVSDREVTQKLRLALQGEASAVGPVARLHKVALVPRDQFARLRIPTAHTTDYGYCVHDFTMLPCPQHQDCMNCDEQACIKGLDARKEGNIRATRNEAKDALDEGEYGADKWVAHQQMTLDRLNSLCSILDDPAVPVGAVIRLNDSHVQTPIEQATQRRPIAGSALALETAPEVTT